MTTSRKNVRSLAFLASTAVLASCAKPLYEGPTVRNEEDFGPTSVSVLSVSKWESVRSDLQPRYDLTPSGALEAVAPTTMYANDQFMRSLMLRLGIGLPTSGATTTDTTKVDNDVTTESSVDVRTRGSGSAPTPTAATLPAAPASGLNAPSGTVAIEPTLRFSLATSLYQYVKLMNRYVEDLIMYRGYDAYVVRLQVSQMPERRNLPYDTYVDVGFFPEPRTGLDSGEATMPTFLENPQELPPKLGNAQDLQIAPIPLAPGTPDVVVVPLLSTDSVEGLLQGRSVQEVRDAALAVAATVQNVGGSLSAGALQQHLQSVLGRDYNSVSAISVQHQSVLTVRLGAIQQATSKYGIVPRQQSVSVLVFVSKQKFKNSNHEEFRVTPNNVYAIFNVRHVHALEGTKPTFRPRAENRRREIQVASQYFDPILVRKLDFDLLQDAVRQNDWNNFRAQIKTANDKETKEHKVPSAAAIGSLWLALSGESSPSLSTPMQIRLPILSEEDLRTSIALPQESQTFFLLDDGKSVSGTLRGGSNLQSGSLEAELHADQLVDSSKTAKIDISQKPIISDVAEVSGSGGAVHVSFPSLAAGKWTAENPSVKVNFKVKRYSGLTKPSSTGEEFWEAHGTYPAVIINTKPEPAAPNKPATLTVKDGHVNVAQGKAFVNIKVAAPTNGKQYSITIVSTAGASIGGVGPAGQTALEQSGNQWLIKSDGEVLLEIRGAASGQTFSIQMIDKDGSQITVAPVTVD